MDHDTTRRRCAHSGCQKKLPLCAFKCRCDATFCGAHRYPEDHACSFDFRGAGQAALRASNPVIQFSKLERV